MEKGSQTGIVSWFPILVPGLEGTLSYPSPGAGSELCQQTRSFFASGPRKHLLESLRGKLNALLRRVSSPLDAGSLLRGFRNSGQSWETPKMLLGEDQETPRQPQTILLRWVGITRKYKLELPYGQPQHQDCQ